MSEQHGPSAERWEKEPRWLKRRRDKDVPWTARDFQLGAGMTCEYRTRSGRTVRLLVCVEDVYEHEVLHPGWKSKVALYGRVCGVQEEDQRGMVGRIVSVSVDEGGIGWFSRNVRLRDDLDASREVWM